jgi:glycerate 2-kinase
MQDNRSLADDIRHTLIKSAFEKHIQYSRGVLRVREDLYQLDSYSRVLVVAFGVYAHNMVSLLAGQIGHFANGIISTQKDESRPQCPGFRYFDGGHPLPDAESLRAADAILKSLSALDSRALAIYLVSSGSSFVESPIDKEISIADMAQTYKVVSESDATPAEAKTILKHLSAVKGGRLALAAGTKGALQLSIFLPDSSGGDLSSIACGPTMPDLSTVEDCYRIESQYALKEKFPASVRELFEQHALDDTPDKDHPAFHNCRWWPIID